VQLRGLAGWKCGDLAIYDPAVTGHLMVVVKSVILSAIGIGPVQAAECWLAVEGRHLRLESWIALRRHVEGGEESDDQADSNYRDKPLAVQELHDVLLERLSLSRNCGKGKLQLTSV